MEGAPDWTMQIDAVRNLLKGCRQRMLLYMTSLQQSTLRQFKPNLFSWLLPPSSTLAARDRLLEQKSFPFVHSNKTLDPGYIVMHVGRVSREIFRGRALYAKVLRVPYCMPRLRTYSLPFNNLTPETEPTFLTKENDENLRSPDHDRIAISTLPPFPPTRSGRLLPTLGPENFSEPTVKHASADATLRIVGSAPTLAASAGTRACQRSLSFKEGRPV